MNIRRQIPLAILATFVAVTSALHATSVENPLPVPLPDFQTPAQLAKWRADTTAKTVAKEAAQATASAKTDSSTGFYTGKPYLAESGSYSFKYREYNPETARWTTVDPSGFPDGANNRLYAAVPTSQFDSNGFWITAVYSITKQTFTIDNQVFGGCNSGDNNVDHQSSQYAYVGPLPTGEYNIFDRPGGIGGHSAFILDPIDSVTQNDHWDSGVGQGRGNFRLHINGTTEGCIATSSIDQIANIIYSSAGSSMEYTINTGDGVTFNTPLYGKLTVVE